MGHELGSSWEARAQTLLKGKRLRKAREALRSATLSYVIPLWVIYSRYILMLYVDVFVYLFVCTYIYICIGMYVCVHARTYVCTYVYVVLHLFFVEGLLACIHMCVCMYAYV